MEQQSGGSQELAEALVLKAAKTLQSSFAKQTSGGEPRKWRDVPADEKKVWLRLARAAERIFREEEAPPPAAPAKTLAGPPISGTQEKVLAPAPKPTAPPPAAKPMAPPLAAKPVAPPPAPARDPVAAKTSAAAPAATAKPANSQKAQGSSAMLRLLGLKPRDAA